MLVKTSEFKRLIPDLRTIFSSIRKSNMWLNPRKCAFAVEAGKFLGFMLTHRGIEANLEMCKEVLYMKDLTLVKEVQRLTGRLTSLSRFLFALAKKLLPLFALLKKK